MDTPSPLFSAMMAALCFCQFPFAGLDAQQSFTLKVNGWNGADTPVFSGAGANVLSLFYGDSLHSFLSFSGEPGDGLGADADNIAYMDFSYACTIYLTPAGATFSASSIPLGHHYFSATQSCNSSLVNPWTLICDAQIPVISDTANFALGDRISDCISPGNYQVDILFDSFSISTGGPDPQLIQLQWLAAACQPGGLNLPAMAFSSPSAFSAFGNNLLRHLAYLTIKRPDTCPPLSISLPSVIRSLEPASATVLAAYPGQCRQNALQYRWSNGDSTATATSLQEGSYTVTVVSPCGIEATAEVYISNKIVIPSANALQALELDEEHIRQSAAMQEQQPDGRHSEKQGRETDRPTTMAPLVFPNPANDRLTIYPGENGALNQVHIFDMNGKEVQTDFISIESGQITAGLSRLRPGTYLWVDGSLSGKFVKQ